MFFAKSEIKQEIIRCCQALELHPKITGLLLLVTFGNGIPKLYSQMCAFRCYSFIISPGENSTYTPPPPLDHFLTSNGDTSYLTLHLHQWWQKKSHTFFSKQRTKILHWAIYHFLMTITMMNRTIRLNKNGHPFLYLIYFVLVAPVRIISPDSRSLSSEPSCSASFGEARFQSLTNFSSGDPTGPDTISILMMS